MIFFVFNDKVTWLTDWRYLTMDGWMEVDDDDDDCLFVCLGWLIWAFFLNDVMLPAE